MSSALNPSWAEMHRDAEMSYILQSVAESVPKTSSFRVFAETVAEVFTRTMHEREPETAALFNAKDLAPISAEVFALKGLFKWFSKAPCDLVANQIAFAWLIYIHSLLLGAPSPRAKRDHYNPFANEGGFCNPRKLKLLQD